MAKIRSGQSGPIIISGTDTITGMTNPNLVEKIGDYCFVVENLINNLITIDVSDPTDISEDKVTTIGGTDNAYTGIASDLTGNYLYILGSTGWLKVMDVSNPLLPSYVTQTAVFSSGTRDIVRTGNYLFITCGHFVSCVDITTPSSPVLLGSAGGFGSTLQSPVGIDTDGTYCYVACNFTDRFTIIENAPLIAASPGSSIGSTANIGSITNSTDLDFLGDVVKVGNYCYVSSSTLDRIIIIDVSIPSTPSIYDFLSNSYTDAIISLKYSTYLYAGSTQDAITLIDISNPANIYVVRYYQDVGVLDYPEWFVVDGNYIYVPCQGSDLFTILSLNG